MKADLVGQVLGGYRLDKLLGEGGFASVFLARRLSIGDAVAVKVLHAHLSSDEDFIRRFQQEARIAFTLRHDKIVRTFDFQQLEGRHFLVMEYVDGPTLRDLLLQRGDIDGGEADDERTRLYQEAEDGATRLRGLSHSFRPMHIGHVTGIGLHLCDALAYAHDLGVIHRDLKPENVFVTPDGRALLGDFGIARAQEASHLTRTGLRIGSVAYMSPEQIMGREIDRRADIYSLGIMLYEMLSGTVPFVGSDTAVWQMHLQEAPVHPSTLRGDLPDALEQVVLRCLEKEPAARYDSAREVAAALSAACHPTSLTDLVGTRSGAQGRTEQHRKQEALKRHLTVIGNCPHCGYALTEGEREDQCPACLQPLGAGQAAAERNRLGQATTDFVNGFNLDAGLPLEVRAYEYDRRIEPALRQRFGETEASWRSALAAGSVASPASAPGSRTEASRTLAAAKGLLNLAQLWESQEVDAFVVNLGAQRQRAKGVAELRGRAYQLLGLWHSLRGAAGSSNDQMVTAYTAAKGWHDEATRVAEQAGLDLTPATRLGTRVTQMILLYPTEGDAAISAAAGRAEGLPPPELWPGVAADLATLNDYRNARENAGHAITGAIDRARRLLGEVQTCLTARDAKLLELTARKQAEEARETQLSDEIRQAYAGDVGRFARRSMAARIGVLLAPLLLTVMAAWVITLLRKPANLGVALLVAAGALTLPCALGYLVRRFSSRTTIEPWDLGMVAAAAASPWTWFGMVFWYFAGPGRAAGISTDILRRATFWFALGVILWLVVLVWAAQERRREQIWRPSLRWTVFTIVIAAASQVLGFYHAAAIWRWAAVPSLRLGLLAAAVVLLLLGWWGAEYIRRMMTAEAVAELERARALKKLHATSIQALGQIQEERARLVSTTDGAVKRLVAQTSDLLRAVRFEAEKLSARLLRTKAAAELADVSEIEAGLSALSSSLSRPAASES